MSFRRVAVGLGKIFNFFVPDTYLMHFTYRCRCLNCSVQRAVWVGERGSSEYEVNSLRNAGGWGACLFTYMNIKLTTYSTGTENRIPAKLMCIKLPMNLFFKRL